MFRTCVCAVIMKYLLVLLLVSTGLAETITKARMPILNYLHAPVVAELDITSVKNDLKGYIDIKIENQVNQTWNAEIKTIVSDKLLSLKFDMLEEFSNSLNRTRQSFDVKLNAMIEQFTLQFKLIEQNWKVENAKLIQHLNEGNEAWKQKLLKENEEMHLLFKELNNKLTSKQETEHGYLEYALIFTEPFTTVSTTPIVYLSSTENGIIHMTNPTQSIHIQKGRNMILLNESVFTADGVEKKGVHIISSVPVTIYGFQRFIDTCDGYLAIPMKRMSIKYIVPSFTVWTNRALSKSLIGIISLQKDTVINVKLKMNEGVITFKNKQYKNGETITAQMSEFETLQLSNNFDLSGSIVTSSHPIGIVSGNKCNSITHAACNHFTEMILPADQLDNVYIVPVLQSRSKSTIRILSPNKASVTVYTGNTISRNLEEGDFFDFQHTEVSYITSTGDVLVMMYPHEENGGDSYMMTIVGVNQYKSGYQFIVPEGFQSFISITFAGEDAQGFEIDNRSISALKILKRNVNQITCSTFSIVVTDGSHSIMHRSKVPFGLWVYGTRTNDGYGFPGGMAYRQN